MEDYYDILGVRPTATRDEIRSAYRRLVKQRHPDVCNDPNAHTVFIRITEAYEVLSNPELRTEYEAARAGKHRRSRSDQRYEDRSSNREHASSWEQSETYQQARQWAYQRAEEYWNADLSWVLASLLRATATVTRVAWQGQKGVPEEMELPRFGGQ